MDAMQILRAEGAGIGIGRGFPETVEIGVAGIIEERWHVWSSERRVEVVLCPLSAITSGSAPRDADLPRTRLELAFFLLSLGLFESTFKLRGLGGVTSPPRTLPENPLITSPFRSPSCVVAATQLNILTRHQIWQLPCRDSSRRS
jgi:hypothetical protein